MHVRGKSQFSLRRKLTFSVVAVLLFGTLLESGLRIFRFRWSIAVETMSFSFPLDEFNTNSEVPFLQRDDRLFWKPRPHVLGHNSRGMIGAEFTNAKPPGVFRIVCLGDSCTHFGPDSYPECLQVMLDRQSPQRFEVINAGCVGYSSFQGLMRLKNEVSQWSPDLITVYFGWNDHWLAHHRHDNEQRNDQAALLNVHDTMGQFRIYQLINFGVTRLATRVDPKMRVERHQYEANLREMHRIGDELGADVWYMTAPQAFDLGIPDFLFTSGEVADPFSVIELHDSYNEVVRSVAQDLKAVCIDLEHEIDRLNKQDLFLYDHIHLSDEGRLHVANELFVRLHQGTLLDSSLPK